MESYVMYTTIFIISCHNELDWLNISTFLEDSWGAEIDQELDCVTQYTLVSRHEPDLVEFEQLISDCEDKDLIVNYVCCGFRQININAVREYSNGNWKFK